MNATTNQKSDVLLAVDIKGLSAMLSCGQSTARKIGEQSGARFEIGRRVLYSVEKVQSFLSKMAD